MTSKYVDVPSIMQVIGCVYNNPSLLDFTDKYTITDEDFLMNFIALYLALYIRFMNQAHKKSRQKILVTF